MKKALAAIDMTVFSVVLTLGCWTGAAVLILNLMRQGQ